MKNFILEIQQEIWMDSALCKSSDTDVFFPVGMSTKAIKKIEKAICKLIPRGKYLTVIATIDSITN